MILKHRTIDLARARDRRPAVVDTAVFESAAVHEAADPVGELEVSLSIYRAIRALPERQHDVIVLRYCLGYTTAETADILGISRAGVRSTIRFARRHLKEALGEELLGLGLEKEGSDDD